MRTLPWIVHLLAEGIAGALLLLRPRLFFSQASAAHEHLARTFGLAAITLALLSLPALRRAPAESLRWLARLLLFYHLGVLVLQTMRPMEGTPPWLAPGFHGLLALAFALQAFARKP